MSRSTNTLPPVRRASARPFTSLRYGRPTRRYPAGPTLVQFDPCPERSWLRIFGSPAAVHSFRKIAESQARARTRLALHAAIGRANSSDDDLDDIDIVPTRHRGSAIWNAS